MSAVIIDGAKIANELLSILYKKVLLLKEKEIIPSLAIVQVGDNKASNIYIRNKINKAKQIGIDYHLIKMPDTSSENELLHEIDVLNKNDLIHGIIVQMPIPIYINNFKIINAISPDKDVDGFHPVNIGRLVAGGNGLFPCTPSGIMILIKKYIKDLSGKKALVIGRSNIVGRPMSFMLLRENCTVTIAHSYTKNLEDEVRQADIVIAAIGKSKFVKGEFFKKNAMVIDVGINYVDNIITGDVEFEEAKKNVAFISPVPKGVGPMTIACLLKNTIMAACANNNLKYDDL